MKSWIVIHIDKIIERGFKEGKVEAQKMMYHYRGNYKVQFFRIELKTLFRYCLKN